MEKMRFLVFKMFPKGLGKAFGVKLGFELIDDGKSLW